MTQSAQLTVAVTGPTGTFGFGFVPLLQADDRIGRIIGIARRPFDPAEHGWTKMEYRRGDVRDRAQLEEAFRGVDVVVHLAFLITGASDEATIRAVNIDGTRNVFEAAAAAGVRRFVYASSVAAYGFHPDNPIGMDETWPTRPADKLFYAQEKAELEELLKQERLDHPELEMYLVRPPIVVGPHAVGAKFSLPRLPWKKGSPDATTKLGRSPLPIPVPAPTIPLQFIHEADVGQALLQCTVAAGPPGDYNIAGDGVVTAADVAKVFGFLPVPIPAAVAHRASRLLAKLPRPPFVPPAVEWVEAAAHPAIMDTTKAKRDLGFDPQYTAVEALQATVGVR
ncbi:MAG: NAD-dependent epimerase/dehydratase family protein [Jatrophihabitans sp.]|uniref:NAD-dependent epimerase/dehydratase family protein n=1 Tax=Jatrophihabitans sp. TaxID=1932789 RepID=UPI003F802C10